ncbi:MAG: ribose ABC transporter permease, partial [Anaerolineales bacterium]
MSSSRVRGFLQRYGLVVSFLILCLVLSLLSDRFLTVGNLTNVLRQSTINLIIAIGMTYVILTAGIDLSVGAVLALATVVTADLLQRGVPILPTVVLGLLLGGVLGMANGLLISRVKVPAFVATLGMMTVARGLALTYTQGRPITGLPDAFRYIGTGYLGPVPMPIIVAGITFLAGYILLTRTR